MTDGLLTITDILPCRIQFMGSSALEATFVYNSVHTCTKEYRYLEYIEGGSNPGEGEFPVAGLP
jgi:hypothetical protein